MNTGLRFLLLSSLLLGVQNPAVAVSDAACLWLGISPSTVANGMGNLASPYSMDPMAAWFLPGVSGIGPDGVEGVTLEFSGYRPRTDWLYSGTSLGHKAMRVRAPMDKALDQVAKWVPGIRWRPTHSMSISFSVMQQNLLSSSQGWLDEQGDVLGYSHWKEWSTSARLEIGWHRRSWNFGAGLGYDFITSAYDHQILLDNQVIDRSYDVKAGTFDWGLVAEQKLLDRVPLWAEALQLTSSPPQIDLGVTGSWARNFVGGEVQYSSEFGSDPLPRQDRIALATRLRVIHGGSGLTSDLDMLRVHVAVEHIASLVDKQLNPVIVNGIRDTDPGGYVMDRNGTDVPDTYSYDMEYKLFEPDIFSDDDDITRSWGTEVSLFDMFTVRKGRFEDHEGSILEDTSGWGLDSNGLFRLIERGLPGSHSQPVLGWMLRSVRVRYDHAEWESTSPRDGTQFRQVTVDVAF